MPGVWSILQTTLGETSQRTWAGWTVVSRQVWHSTDTTVSSQSDHVKTEGGRAADETVGEGSDVSTGAGEVTRGEETEATFSSTKEKDGESESVGRASSLAVRRLRRSRFDDAFPHEVSQRVHHELRPYFRGDRQSLRGTPGQ